MEFITEWKNADPDTEQLTVEEAKEMHDYLYNRRKSPMPTCKCGRTVGTNVIYGPFCLGEVCAEDKFTDYIERETNIVCSEHETMRSLDWIVQKEKMTENEARMNDFINQGIKEYLASINPCVTATLSTSSSTA